MHLAKSRIDIGLATNNLQPMLRFWQDEVGTTFDHVLASGIPCKGSVLPIELRPR